MGNTINTTIKIPANMTDRQVYAILMYFKTLWILYKKGLMSRSDLNETLEQVTLLITGSGNSDLYERILNQKGLEDDRSILFGDDPMDMFKAGVPPATSLQYDELAEQGNVGISAGNYTNFPVPMSDFRAIVGAGAEVFLVFGPESHPLLHKHVNVEALRSDDGAIKVRVVDENFKDNPVLEYKVGEIILAIDTAKNLREMFSKFTKLGEMSDDSFIKV